MPHTSSQSQVYMSKTDTRFPMPNINVLLSKSYSVFMISLLVGIIFDLFIGLRIKSELIEPIGLVVIFLGSVLVFWAQTVNKKAAYLKNGQRNFAIGPYRFSRHPTYLGLFIVLLGAGFLMSSVSIVVTSVLAFLLTMATFVKEEEKRHVKKYGEQYLQYMKQTRRIL